MGSMSKHDRRVPKTLSLPLSLLQALEFEAELAVPQSRSQFSEWVELLVREARRARGLPEVGTTRAPIGRGSANGAA